MKIAVIGTGYVGLVTGTCFAECGNDVICIDKDARKIALLEEGGIPIYEPGLQEMVQRNRKEGRLVFTTSLPEGIAPAQLIFIAVGTPQAEDGSADLSTVFAVADALGEHTNGPKIVVIKSTVPVGTNRRVGERIAFRTSHDMDVASNPEFLKEGAAIEDCLKPDRVVVGVRRPETAEVLRELYAPFLRTERPFLVMSPESAEMTKYAANAMLATKISYINEMANLCEKVGADINDVRRGIGHDARIGFQFLFPGAGYGGSCFPKDIRAIINMSKAFASPTPLMAAVDDVNEAQKQVLCDKVAAHYGATLREKTLAVWGLAFKPRTDDIREAPALVLINSLLAAGAKLRVHDPEAMGNVKAIYGDRLVYCDRPYGALEGAHGLVIVTEWAQFRNPDFELMRRLLAEAVVFDGRNLYEPHHLAEAGFTYHSIGRQTVARGAAGVATGSLPVVRATRQAGCLSLRVARTGWRAPPRFSIMGMSVTLVGMPEASPSWATCSPAWPGRPLPLPGNWPPRPLPSRFAGSVCSSATSSSTSAITHRPARRPQRHPHPRRRLHAAGHLVQHPRPGLPGSLSADHLLHGSPVHRPAVLLRHRPGKPVPLLLLPVAHLLRHPPSLPGHLRHLRPALRQLRSALPRSARPRRQSLFPLALTLVMLGWVTWASNALATLLKSVGEHLGQLNDALQENQAELEAPHRRAHPPSCRRRRPTSCIRKRWRRSACWPPASPTRSAIRSRRSAPWCRCCSAARPTPTPRTSSAWSAASSSASRPPCAS